MAAAAETRARLMAPVELAPVDSMAATSWKAVCRRRSQVVRRLAPRRAGLPAEVRLARVRLARVRAPRSRETLSSPTGRRPMSLDRLHDFPVAALLPPHVHDDDGVQRRDK